MSWGHQRPSKVDIMQLPDLDAGVFAASPETMIELPSLDACDNAVLEIVARGNIPLLIGEKILAEVANTELSEGLAATESLSNGELTNISTGLAESLSEALKSGCAACDMTAVAADAAALFVLCLRRSQLLDVDNLPACSVSFGGKDNDAQLTLAG